MRSVFPDGQIPLARPGTQAVWLLEDGREIPAEVYFLALAKLTTEQLERAAEKMAADRQGTKEEALAFLREQTELPVRAFNLSGVSMPLRAFL